jgi:uncharacterized membrane protein YciS (DUF1049 family)
VSAPASNPVPRVNRRVFGAFAALLVLFVLAIIGWDMWLYSRTGDGSETISWSVALLAASDPLVTHAFVLAVGLVVGGLLVHFFHFRLPSPVEVAERERLRAEVERLRGPASEGRPEPPGLTWEAYNR